MKEPHLIYALINPITDNVYYIGFTSKDYKYLEYNKLSLSSSYETITETSKIVKNGKEPIVKILTSGIQNLNNAHSVKSLLKNILVGKFKWSFVDNPDFDSVKECLKYFIKPSNVKNYYNGYTDIKKIFKKSKDSYGSFAYLLTNKFIYFDGSVMKLDLSIVRRIKLETIDL